MTSYVRFMIILFSSRLQVLRFDTQDERDPIFIVSCEILLSRFARNLLWYFEPESLGWLLKSSSPCGGALERDAAMACPVSGVLSRVS